MVIAACHAPDRFGTAWSIRQKQTGADRLTLGGALSANAHGRGLRMRPIIDDVRSFTLLTADGTSHRCSRNENAHLFRACVIFNLHVDHSPEGITQAQSTFRGLIDIAIERGGSFFLTYHSWATAAQIRACYQDWDAFCQLKAEVDPQCLFRSDWWAKYENG